MSRADDLPALAGGPWLARLDSRDAVAVDTVARLHETHLPDSPPPLLMPFAPKRACEFMTLVVRCTERMERACPAAVHMDGIVRSPEEAISAFLQSHLDFLVLGPFLVRQATGGARPAGAAQTSDGGAGPRR